MRNDALPDRETLYPPAIACPGCGSRPALRVSAALVESLLAAPPGLRVATYRCQRRQCGRIYDIPAAAFQRLLAGARPTAAPAPERDDGEEVEDRA